MLSTIAFAILTQGTAPARPTPHPTPKAAANALKTAIYVATPSGYEVALTESNRLASGEVIIRIRYLNASSKHSIDILQAASREKSTAATHGKEILAAKLFSLPGSGGATTVFRRKGKTDFVLIGTMMSERSASRILDTLSLVKAS